MNLLLCQETYWRYTVRILYGCTTRPTLSPKSNKTQKESPLQVCVVKYQKNYKVFVVDEPSGICGRVLSQGVAFCMNKECSINHRAIDTTLLAKGELYVVKSTEKGRMVAFLEPSCLSNKIDQAFVEKWLTWSKSLEAWTIFFVWLPILWK